MSKKLLSAALILSAFAMPVSSAFAAPQSHGGGHGGGAMASHMDRDAHGDAVSAAAASARASDSKVGPEVRSVANDKNKGKHEAHGHSKSHGH